MEKPTLRIKRLSPTAIVPKYQSDGAGGLDLHVDGRGNPMVANNIAGPNIFPTGLAIEIPPGYVGLIRPRSSAVMRGTRVLPGTIDSDYRGEVGIQVEGSLMVAHGERIAQLVLVAAPQMHIVEVDELTATARGDRGFGSTGR